MWYEPGGFGQESTGCALGRGYRWQWFCCAARCFQKVNNGHVQKDVAIRMRLSCPNSLTLCSKDCTFRYKDNHRLLLWQP